MSTEKPTTVVAVADKPMEFVPFGGKDPVKLSIAIVRRLIAVNTKTGKAPTDDDCIRFMMLCSAKRLNPFESDAYLIGYDTQDGPKFSLITAHQAFLKRAEANPEYDGMESGVIVMRDGKLVDVEGDFHLDGDTIVGGWAVVHFKNREFPMKKRIRLARFNTGKSQWAKDPAGMICKCAEADALRSSFPTLLGGLYLNEEMDNEPAKEVKQPIFKSSVTTDVAAEVKKIEPEKPLVTVRRLCESSGLSEEKLLAGMKDIGLADDNSTTLDEQSDVDLVLILNDWEDFVSRMKGAAK